MDLETQEQQVRDLHHQQIMVVEVVLEPQELQDLLVVVVALVV
jgi:hypothetical protein